MATEGMLNHELLAPVPLVVPGTPGHTRPAGGWGRDPPWGHFCARPW